MKIRGFTIPQSWRVSIAVACVSFVGAVGYIRGYDAGAAQATKVVSEFYEARLIEQDVVANRKLRKAHEQFFRADDMSVSIQAK